MYAVMRSAACGAIEPLMSMMFMARVTSLLVSRWRGVPTAVAIVGPFKFESTKSIVLLVRPSACAD